MESITSSNYEFRHVGRRRYHGIEGNRYLLPNDADEVSRLDDLHYLYRCLLGRNIVAPITPKPTHILDVGTGSGRWAIEVADQYEETNVVGIDLSPTSPSYEVPDNCEFIVADLTEGLDFDEGSLDLVHSRIVTAGIMKRQWSPYMSEIYRVLKPGTGWAECIEFQGHRFFSEGNVPRDSALREFDGYLDEIIADMDIYWNGEHVEAHMREAGFVDVKVKKLKIDIGTWRGDSRLFEARRAALSVFRGALIALTEHMKKYYPDDQERDEFAQRVKADLENPEYRLYTISYVVIGRKPEVKVDLAKKKSSSS